MKLFLVRVGYKLWANKIFLPNFPFNILYLQRNKDELILILVKPSPGPKLHPLQGADLLVELPLALPLGGDQAHLLLLGQASSSEVPWLTRSLSSLLPHALDLHYCLRLPVFSTALTALVFRFTVK